MPAVSSASASTPCAGPTAASTSVRSSTTPARSPSCRSTAPTSCSCASSAQPPSAVLLEIPAGTLDRRPGGTIEPPEEAAPRELAEETGYEAGTWRRVGHFWTAPGFASEAMTLYLATDLRPVRDYGGPEEDEHLQLIRMPWQTALARAEAGEIEDAKTLIGILWVARLGVVPSA